MNADTHEGGTQETLIYQHLQNLQEEHRDELENIVGLLASITNISPEQVNSYLAPGDWKSRLHRQNPPARVQNLDFVLVRVGGREFV
jgi:hypothetical protein